MQFQFTYLAMNIDEKERLARFRDTSNEAISTRLHAAWRASGYATQKDFAAALGMSHTTYNTQESKGRPALSVLHFLYRNHRIDYNFILYGDFLQLPVAVQDALFVALHE